jgi:putative selenium metabolism hydrolase
LAVKSQIMTSQEFAISLCRELVRAPSPSGDEGRAAEIAARVLRELGYAQVTVDEYGSVTGIRQGRTPGPTILLDAHLDAVAVTNPGEWRHDPFGGEIAEGRLWGRGACDDKGALAAMMCGAARIPLDTLRGRIIVSASVCEENLTGAALSYLLDRYTPDLIIAGEPTDLRLGIAQKGRAGIVVSARGVSAHSSRPELGENAVYKMMEAVTRLRALQLPGDPELGRGILELTEMVSDPLPGAGFVPSGCRVRLVERTMPEETAELVLERLRAAVTGVDGVSVQLDEMSQPCYTGNSLHAPDWIPGWRAGPDTGTQALILSGLRQVPLPAETFAAPYGTNASAGAGRRGVPSFIFGPGSIQQAHSVDEWISIEELLKGESAYAAIVAACLGVPSS